MAFATVVQHSTVMKNTFFSYVSFHQFVISKQSETSLLHGQLSITIQPSLSLYEALYSCQCLASLTFVLLSSLFSHYPLVNSSSAQIIKSPFTGNFTGSLTINIKYNSSSVLGFWSHYSPKYTAVFISIYSFGCLYC